MLWYDAGILKIQVKNAYKNGSVGWMLLRWFDAQKNNEPVNIGSLW